MLRPVLVCLSVSGLAVSVASCGADPHRFETLAHSVADIPLGDDGTVHPATAHPATGQASPMAIVMARPLASGEAQGLRPALAPFASDAPAGLKVQVMDPHDLWDARDADLRGRVGQYAPAMIQAAAPAVAGAVVRAVSQRLDQAEGLRPAIARPRVQSGAARSSGVTAAKPLQRPFAPEVRPADPARTTIQLGAYSSETAARSAWSRVSNGAARTALSGLAPVFERVSVNGRTLTRLKVAAPTSTAAAICRAADVSDPWCARALQAGAPRGRTL